MHIYVCTRRFEKKADTCKLTAQGMEWIEKKTEKTDHPQSCQPWIMAFNRPRKAPQGAKAQGLLAKQLDWSSYCNNLTTYQDRWTKPCTIFKNQQHNKACDIPKALCIKKLLDISNF